MPGDGGPFAEQKTAWRAESRSVRTKGFSEKMGAGNELKNMAARLQNQVAWISGAASGMGEAIARLFAEEGAAVALIDVQAAKGRLVAEQIQARGGRAVFIECDLRQENAVRSSIERTAKEF